MTGLGQIWWYGGAYEFAKENNYDDIAMVYDEGDISGLDYHMMRPIIELFSMASLLYIKKGAGDYELYKEMLLEATRNLSVKELHLFSNIWVLLIGKMPSGAYETSIADSWYVALMAFSYVWYMIYKNPEKSELILEELRNHRIKFPVFGDDHILGRRKLIAEFVCEKGFGDYSNKYFGLVVKPSSLRLGLKWLSIPDNEGGLAYAGVSFCQKYSIARPDFMPSYCAEIVPYRLMSACMHKLGYGSRDRFTKADYILAIISAAYDGFGTNMALYKWQAQLYNYVFVSAGYKNIGDVVKEYSNQESTQFDMTKACRKIGVAVETLYQGFPTLETLWRMHVHDAHRCSNFPGFGFFHGERAKDDRFY